MSFSVGFSSTGFDVDTWEPDTAQTETWTANTKQVETWTPVAKQVETWTTE